MNDLELKKLEYRIKPITRFVVTKYEEWGEPDNSPSQSALTRNVSEAGTFDNPDMAWEVGYALCKERHRLIGWPPGDESIQYPEHPTNKGAARQAEVV